MLFDTTNFFTYISSTNAHYEIAKPAKNKQRRYDLRQFICSTSIGSKERLTKIRKGILDDSWGEAVSEKPLSDLAEQKKRVI